MTVDELAKKMVETWPGDATVLIWLPGCEACAEHPYVLPIERIEKLNEKHLMIVPGLPEVKK